MKTLETLYHEIAADPSLSGELARAVQRGEAARFLADQGCQATPEEALAFLSGRSSRGALADEELDNVTGGSGCGLFRRETQEVDAVTGAAPSISKPAGGA